MALLKRVKPEVDFSNEDLLDSGLLDSLDIVEVIEEIENEFGIEIQADDIDPDHFVSVEAMWNMVQKY